MKRIVLISCVKTKLDHTAKAEKLYISDLFVKNLDFCQEAKARLHIHSLCKIWVIEAE